MLRPTTHRQSKLQEKRAAVDYGGSTTPASGATWHSKGDVKTLNYLVECKTTTKDSYRLFYSDLHKITIEAITEGKSPLFEVEFSHYGKSYVVLHKQDFLEMKQRLEYGS